jgi:DNA-binding Lrp family transcriptional regulator
MEKTDAMRWYNKDKKIWNSFAEKEYELIYDYVENNITRLISAMDGDEKEFGNNLSYGAAILKRFENTRLKSDEYKAIYALGELKGVIDACAHLENEKIENKNTADQVDEIEMYDYSAVKYIDEIVKLLSENISLKHKELAKRLGISDPKLTEAIKRIDKYRLIDYRRVGKFKLYALSDKGKRYGNQMRNNKVRQPNKNVTNLTTVIEVTVETNKMPSIQEMLKLNENGDVFELDHISHVKSLKKNQLNIQKMTEINHGEKEYAGFNR